MTWTSDYGAQKACLKGARASGPEGLGSICYYIPHKGWWLIDDNRL